jgi:hypothetical protein
VLLCRSSKFPLQLLLTESWCGQGAACLHSCAAVYSLAQLYNKASLVLDAVIFRSAGVVKRSQRLKLLCLLGLFG